SVARVLVALMKSDFLPPAARGEKGDWTRDERELQITFPIRPRGHRAAPIATRINESESYPVPAVQWRRLSRWQVCVADLFSPAAPARLGASRGFVRSHPWLLPP